MSAAWLPPGAYGMSVGTFSAVDERGEYDSSLAGPLYNCRVRMHACFVTFEVAGVSWSSLRLDGGSGTIV